MKVNLQVLTSCRF